MSPSLSPDEFCAIVLSSIQSRASASALWSVGNSKAIITAGKTNRKDNLPNELMDTTKP